MKNDVKTNFDFGVYTYALDLTDVESSTAQLEFNSDFAGASFHVEGIIVGTSVTGVLQFSDDDDIDPYSDAVDPRNTMTDFLDDAGGMDFHVNVWEKQWVQLHLTGVGGNTIAIAWVRGPRLPFSAE